MANNSPYKGDAFVGGAAGGFGGSIAGSVLGATTGAVASRGNPEMINAGAIIGNRVGKSAGAAAGSHALAKDSGADDRTAKRIATGGAIGGLVPLPFSGGFGARFAAGRAEKSKMRAGSAEIASSHAERDVARKRHASYYTRRQGGKIQRVKYTYPERRN